MLSYPKLSQYRGQKYLQVHSTVSISYLAFLDYYIAISVNPKLTVAEFYFPGGASGKDPACQGKRSLGQENPLEEGVAIHSSILAWKISWTEKPGRLWSIGSQRVGHDWSNLTGAADFYLKMGINGFWHTNTASENKKNRKIVMICLKSTDCNNREENWKSHIPEREMTPAVTFTLEAFL